jgi:acetyl-CoA/propionyl-CoA carboxylase biotin carboxyl carrier protein
VEFLLARDGSFYFLEMNTRIQVEHPVTEMVTGVDLIREMVLAAAGESITVRDNILDPDGHAIEVRINAEDPLNDFRPTPATITGYRVPGGAGVRLDSGVYAGWTIPPDYDSLIAKLIAWAPDRSWARVRTLRALREFDIEGPATTVPFARAVLEHPAFVNGELGTIFVGEHLAELEELTRPFVTRPAGESTQGPQRGETREFEVDVNRRLYHVRVAELRATEQRASARPRPRSDGRASNADQIVSPMHGTVMAIKVEEGAEVAEGQTAFVIEAMKMENEIRAQRAGLVARVEVEPGETVESGQVLATLQ